MDRVILAGWLVVLLTVLVVGRMIYVATFPEPPRDYPSYCIDPFTSADMGTVTYTPCKLVPMWSMKV